MQGPEDDNEDGPLEEDLDDVLEVEATEVLPAIPAAKVSAKRAKSAKSKGERFAKNTKESEARKARVELDRARRLSALMLAEQLLVRGTSEREVIDVIRQKYLKEDGSPFYTIQGAKTLITVVHKEWDEYARTHRAENRASMRARLLAIYQKAMASGKLHAGVAALGMLAKLDNMFGPEQLVVTHQLMSQDEAVREIEDLKQLSEVAEARGHLEPPTEDEDVH